MDGCLCPFWGDPNYVLVANFYRTPNVQIVRAVNSTTLRTIGWKTTVL